MQINRSLQLNEWDIKSFLQIVLSIQLAVFVFVCLDILGISIPIIGPLVCFVFLAFIPGVVVIRALKLHGLNNIEACIYSVALSLAVVMFSGLITNFILRQFGFLEPLSILPLFLVISGFTGICCVICYMADAGLSMPKADAGLSKPIFTNPSFLASPVALILLTLPFFAIFGTYLVNYYQNGALLIVMVLFVGAIAMLVGYGKVPSRFYPLAITGIALALLYQNSLLTPFVVGFSDMNSEFYAANVVLTNSYWDPQIATLCSSALSVAILAPIFSIFSKLDLGMVFKIFYPILYLFVPLGIYRIAQKQTNDQTAFLSSFLYIATSVFFTTMLGKNRTIVALIFLISLVLLLIDREMNDKKRSLLFIVFACCLGVSHYTVAYMGLYMLLFMSFGLVFVKHGKMIEKIGLFFAARMHRDSKNTSNRILNRKWESRDNIIVLTIITWVFFFTWSMYTEGGSISWIRAAQVIAEIPYKISSDLLQTSPGSGVELISRPSTFVNTLYKGWVLTTQVFIVIGIIVAALKLKKNGFLTSYIVLSLSTLPLFFMSIFVASSIEAVGAIRLYYLSLTVLAPFSVFGGIVVLEAVSSIIKHRKKLIRSFSYIDLRANQIKILSVFFVIYFMFNVGFVQQFTGVPTSFALSGTKIDLEYRPPTFNKTELVAAQWLSVNKDPSKNVFAGAYKELSGDLVSSDFMAILGQNDSLYDIPPKAYIFLGTDSVKENIIRFLDPVWRINQVYKSHIVKLSDTKFNNELLQRPKIYDNGGAQVYQ